MRLWFLRYHKTEKRERWFLTMFASVCGKTPRDEGAAFVADTAVVVGDVTLKPGCTVWYGAVIRGDEGPIVIGENANVQDNAVLHCDPGHHVTLGRNVTVGHGAIVHGAEVGEGSLIGMHATLLNGCKVGSHCIVGAGALVPEGREIPDGTVAVGAPARAVKDIGKEQAAFCEYNAIAYVNLGREHAAAVPLKTAKTEE